MHLDWSLVHIALRGATPLLFAAMGGLVCERSGVVNIGLEGLMLFAAFFAAMGSYFTHSGLAGLGIGIIAAVALSSLHVLTTQKFRIDHVVSGVAVNAIAFGGTAFLVVRVFGQAGSTPSAPGLSEWALIPLALMLPVLLWFWLNRTRSGLHVQAVGNDPEKAASMGVSPSRVRTAAILTSGLFCGFGGSFLSLAYVHEFSEAVTAGRGFVALAALILGRWNPIAAALAALGFGLFDALQIRLQGVNVMGVSPPSEVWDSLPYLLTLATLVLFAKSAKPPAALGKV